MKYNIGIVGSEAIKFTPETEEKARLAIRDIIKDAEYVVSGACHLGGIDIWAVEEAKKLDIKTLEFPPANLAWPAYRDRNLQIARYSDICYCITVKDYHKDYKGMRFKYCYHCKTDTHVKSGGCWTVKQAIKMGRVGHIIVVD